MNGKNIAKYREDNGISQVEMAERLGIAPSTLSRWELNKTAPKGEDYDHLKEMIGEEYLTDEDLSETKKTIQAISEVSDRVDSILYQVTKIEENQRSIEIDNVEREHIKIRTRVIILTCIFIMALAFCTWYYWINNGFSGKTVEGPAEMGTPSYFEIDDGQ